jgi:Family of unknown function (DUF6941)
MTVVELPDRFGHSVFCDDIRFEEGGKISLLGVYQGAMYIHGDFPATLPKFGILLRYHERIGIDASKLIFKVFMPGDPDEAPSVAGEVPIEELRKQVASTSDQEGEEPRFHIVQANFVLSPLLIKQPGVIKVRATADSQIIRMGVLRIHKGTVANQPPSMPTAS